MDDPRPVQVLSALNIAGVLSVVTLLSSGLVSMASATVDSSLIVSGPVTGASFSGVGTSLTALNASNLSSGKVPLGCLGASGTPDSSKFFKGDNSWATAVTQVTVVPANGVSASVATQGTTPAFTFTLGAITPSSVAATGAISGTTITAGTGFSGDGSSLTNLSAAALTAGQIPAARLGTNTADNSKFLRGDLTWQVFTTGTVTGLSIVPANGITGTVATESTTPAITLTLGDITPSSVSTGGTVFSVGGFTGPGAGLAGLNASNLASGTVALARLGTGTPDSSKFLSGTNAWATAVTAVTIVTANGVSATVATQGTTPALTITLGAITPSSVAATGALSGTTIGGTTITASTGFVGPGSTITALNASNLGSGTVPTARLGSGTASASTFLTGASTYVTAVTSFTVTAANGVTGTIGGTANIPTITLALGAITPSSVNTTGTVTANLFSGSGASLTNLPVAALTGTIATTNLGSGTASAATFLSGDQTYKTAVTSFSVATANGVSGAITGTASVPIVTLTLGAITPTSVAATGDVGGATVSSSGLATLNSLSVTNNASVGGTLGVTGVATVTGNLVAAGLSATGAGLVFSAAATGVIAGPSGTSAFEYWVAAGASTNSKVAYQRYTTGGVFELGFVTDAAATPTAFLSAARTSAANTTNSLSLTATNINLVGAVSTSSLSVPGTATLNVATVASTLDVTGAFSAAGGVSTTSLQGSSLSVTNNATVGGTLGVTGVISGPGSGLTALNATNLASGTVPIARIGSSGTPSASTYFAGDNSWKPVTTGTVTAVTVATANGISATVATQGTTPVLTIALGAITPSSVSTGSLAATGPATFGVTIGVTGNASFSTLSSSGLATLNSLAVTNAATIGGTLGVTGVVTADSFIATGNTVPVVGIYEGSSAGGISVATSSTERWSVTTGGLITNRSAVADVIVPVSASAVDCSKGNYFTKSYSGALTWTFTNAPSGVFYRFVLKITRTASGTQTWPTTVKWTGGSAPVLTGTNGGYDIIEFMTEDGTNWKGYRLVTSTT